MNRNKITVTISALIFALSFSASVSAEDKVGGVDWKIRMQSMLNDVIKLLPFAFDEAMYLDPKNDAVIQSALDSLAKNALSLKDHTKKATLHSTTKIDPSIRFVAQSFENEVGAAQIAFSGSSQARLQSQAYLQAAIGKCNVCHTQSSLGPALKLDHFKEVFGKLKATDRFQAQVATRQFDEALDTYSNILRDSTVGKVDSRLIDRQAKIALAVAVRVKRDPKLTLKLIQEIEASKSASPMLNAALIDWRNAATTWLLEKSKPSLRDNVVFAQAKQLVDGGNKSETSSGRYKNGNVEMLRASTLLHDLLSNFPNSKLRADSYLLMAKTYDLLPGFSAWDLSEEYLGSCIEEFPHTDSSEKCFRKYQELTVLGYSGSGGTNIPSAVAQHLERMKELAKKK